MDTIKVFISQPMKDKSESEILIARDEAITKIKQMFPDDEVVIIDSYFINYSPKEGNVPLKYLAKSIELLADADVVYFCPGWEKARGCVIEYECAFAYGILRIKASGDHIFDIAEYCDTDIMPTSRTIKLMKHEDYKKRLKADYYNLRVKHKLDACEELSQACKDELN